MPEWIKIVLAGTGLTALFGFLGTIFGIIQLRPKNKIEVKKIEQEIKSDQVTTAIEVTNLMLTRLTQAESRLTYIQDENDKLRVLIVSLREAIVETKSQMKEMLDDFIEYLKTKNLTETLKYIREKYGLDN